MPVPIELIDIQIQNHSYNHIPDWLIKSDVIELCEGMGCPDNPNGDDCNICIGDYNTPDLREIEPDLNWKNLKETIVMAQLLNIKPAHSK